MAISISTRTWFALLGLALAIYIAIPFIPLLLNITVILFLILLLSLLMNPFVTAMQARGVARGTTVAVVLLIVLALLVAAIALVVPLLISAFGALAANAQTLVPRVQSFVARFTDAETASALGTRALDFMSTVLQGVGTSVTGIAASLGSIAFALFVIAACVFTLVADPAAGRELMRYAVPKRFHQRVMSLTASVSIGLSRWFGAQLLICLYYTVCYAIMNLALGIPYGLAIALIAGLLSFIPYIGGFFGLILTLLGAATIGITPAIAAVGIYTVIGLADVYFVSPYLYSRAVEVRPAIILLGLFIGGEIGGFLAALLTVPVITMITILLREMDAQPAELVNDLLTPNETTSTPVVVAQVAASDAGTTPVVVVPNATIQTAAPQTPIPSGVAPTEPPER